MFPYVVLPLQIFEERYRTMIEDSLDGPGRIVLGTVRDGHEDELEGSPPVYSVAGMGEIGRHEKLPDGRFQILLVGISRVRIREVESPHSYRLVEVDPITEIGIPEDQEPALREKLVEAILARTSELTSLPPKIPLGHLIDLLSLRLMLPVPAMNELFSELDLGERARMALFEHAHRPIPPEGQQPGTAGA